MSRRFADHASVRPAEAGPVTRPPPAAHPHPAASPRRAVRGRNRLGLRPYAAATFHHRLGDLTRTLAITDSVGRPVQISKTHTFRHTRATDLINAGVPIHVVMRYLGHLTPAMTMHYAKTLAVTAEREFLRYKKVTADGRTAGLDPSDLYDLLHLDQRADRVLPNGWCMLPPKQVCSKGNACLTCEKFVTDASHRDELQHQLDQTEALITRRQTQFAARHGEPTDRPGGTVR
ncbi:tyrosine-type recombinase/integrase [Streptomyces sp. NPDC059385]|uniref:tyrosine-type recombinase/integrase n=1 Tax=Streptomyces sp. NPDC059385 TaxID=3346817 RepID=UPI0036BAFA1E